MNIQTKFNYSSLNAAVFTGELGSSFLGDYTIFLNVLN